jgi:hypothetical protein
MKKIPQNKKSDGKNLFKSLPFQLGDPEGRFISDSRSMGKTSFKSMKKGK